jgi:hypothetical protein
VCARAQFGGQGSRAANLHSVTDEKQEPAADDWENEGGHAAQEPREKSGRDEFFSNQEQLDRPDDQANGEKASTPGSNPDPSI